MQPVGWTGQGSSWRLAFLLSAAVHALAVLGLSRLPGPKSVPLAEAPCPIITVCQIADDEGDSGNVFLLPLLGQKPAGAAEPVPDKPAFVPKLLSPTGGTDPTAQHSAPAGAISPAAAGAGNAAGHGTGGTGNAFFDVPVQGQKIVYVIDRSSSMGKQGALAIAKRELLASLGSLPEHASFQIIVFNSTAHFLIQSHPAWFQATPDSKALAAQALALLDATNGTVHDRALILALTLQPDAIFFLTDADDLELRYLNEITFRNQLRAAIHVIELNTSNRGRPDMPLQIFARQNRGVYHAVDLVNQ